MAGFRNKRKEVKKDGEIQDGDWVVGEYGQKIQQLRQIKNVFFRVKAM